MSASHEILASGMSIGGVNPAYVLGPALMFATAGVTVKRLTPGFHRTINTGEIGVWFDHGKPTLLPGYTEANIVAAENADIHSLLTGRPLSTVRHYEIAEPSWNFQGWFRTLQPVDVADQPSILHFPIQTADIPRKKLAVEANITWNVMPFGDNPVRAITNIRHLKLDKKDAEAKDPERKAGNLPHPLEERVLQICKAGLGMVLSGKRAEELYKITYLGQTEQEEEEYEQNRHLIRQKMFAECAVKLYRYGVTLSDVEIVPVTLTNAEVNAEAVRTLSVLDAAVVAAQSGQEEMEDESPDNVSPLHGVPHQQVAEA